MVILHVSAINLSVVNSYAAETSDGTIENIYDETKGKFLEKNLNLLAKKAGYAGIDEMVTAAEGGDIKTANDFGHVTVKFGKSFGGDGENSTELVWIPTYLSNSMQGPILTLWLSRTDETAVFNQQWNNGALTKPSSNNYSTSKLRTEYLNNSGVYYNDYGNTSSNITLLESVSYTETSENTHRFQMYTTGILSSYIVAPSQVAWQTGEGCNRLKNDQGWSGNTDGFYFQDKDGNEQTWINDKLWLPSIYEVFDGSVKVNSNLTAYNAKDTNGAANNSASGLWGTNIEERSTDNISSWLRTARGDNYYAAGILNVDGDYGFTHVNESLVVRPALHLNLKAASQVMEAEHYHSFGEWETLIPATCLTDGEKARVCTSDGCDLEDNTETQAIPKLGHSWATEFTVDTPATCTTAGSKSKHCTREGCTAKTEVTTIVATGHSFATDWTSDENEHWHASTCGHDVKEDEATHDWGSGTVTKAATCTEEGVRTYKCSVCERTKTEPISKIAHTEVTDPAVPATCTQTGKTEGKHCGVCNEVLIAQTDIPMLSHTWSTVWSKDGANHWHECTECGAKKDEAAHSFSWVVDTPATVTSTGLKHEECLCGERRNENTVIEILTCEHTDKVHHARVEATCMTAGNVEYWHCNDCGKDIDGSYLELSMTVISIDPDAHSYINYVSDNNATCTADGTKTAQCAHGCGKTDTVTDIGSALGHDMGEWEVTKEATYTEDGEKRRVCSRCDHYETEVIPKLSMSANEITLTLGSEFEYGDEIAPVVSANYGEPVLTWLDESGAELSEKPTMPGSYKLKASVAEDLTAGYTAAEKEVLFTVTKRKVTLAIDPVSSEKGDSLVEVTATVIGGSIVSGEVPYVLNCAPDKDTVGEYPVTWAYADGFDEKYEITCDGGVYIVSKNADDPNGGGEIDLPVDINVEFKVTQSSTNNNYSELEGMKCGYWAQLWYRNDDGTLGDEFTENINCILTLKIPNEIIEAIRGGEEINRDKIAEGLSVYYINGNGQLVEVENFKIAQKEDESWIIKFNYNEKFRAEVVFNAAEVSEQSPAKSGTPWWVWLIVGLAGAAVIGVVIVLIVVAKKKNAAVVGGAAYDDAELKAKLSEQDKKLDEIKDIIDGGFNDIIDE